MHRDKQGKDSSCELSRLSSSSFPNWAVSSSSSSSWILKMQLALSAIWSLVNERIKSRYKGVSIDIYCPDYTLVKFARNSQRKTFSRIRQTREVLYKLIFAALFILYPSVQYLWNIFTLLLLLLETRFIFISSLHLEMIFDIESSANPYFNI